MKTTFFLCAAVLASSFVVGCGAGSSDESDEDTGALEQGQADALKSLRAAASLLVYSGDASATIAQGDARFAAALAAINLDQRPSDPPRVMAMCPSTQGVRFLGADKKVVGVIAVPCGEAPAKTNHATATILDPEESTVGLTIDGSALDQIAKGSAPASAPTGPLAALATATSVELMAEDKQRRISKTEAAFGAVMTAMNLSQQPFDASEVPVAMCVGTHAARFIGASGVIAMFRLTCGESPGPKNRVIITIGEEEAELGIVVDGAALARLASDDR